MMFLALGAASVAVAACIPRAWLELLIGDPTDPNANADEARDWQCEWEQDVAASGDTDFNTQTTEEV